MSEATNIPPGMKQDLIVVFQSPNGRDQWAPIKPEEVPEWLKHPDVMGKLVAGDMAMDPKKSLFWYRAEKVPSENEIRRIAGNARRHAKIALRKRKRRAH